MKDVFYAVVAFLLVVALVAAFGALFALVFWVAWNAVAPLFWDAAPHLTFWQAWGCTILLGLVGRMFGSHSKSTATAGATK